MSRVMIVCTMYGPPWNEGEKNIARVLERSLGAHGFEAFVWAKRAPDPTAPPRHRPSLGGLMDNLRFWAEIGRTARARGVDVIHVLTSLSSALGLKSFCIRTLAGTPVLLHVTGLSRPTRGYRTLLRADRVVVGGTYLQPFFPGAEEIPPVSPHVNQDNGAGVPASRPPGRGARLLYLGAMEPVRGVHTFVEGMARLRDARGHGDVCATIAWNGCGDQAYAASMRTLVARHGLDAHVRWEGVVTDLGALYRAHDVVVIPPAGEERMGFPLRLIEALSYGRPVVVSDVGELPRVAVGCGLVFPREDAGALAGALIQLLDTPGLYDACVTHAVARAAEYDGSVTVGRLAALYRELMQTG